MDDTTQRLNRWLEHETLDQRLRKELETLKANGELDEIYERFYRDLEFGTGGLRGILGAGINRMNIYTVRKTSQGIANYINANHSHTCGCKRPSVAIGYDSRINSKLFAENVASVFIANNIHAYLYDELMPAPAISFATRYHRCAIGVMITASHNPAEYNGYKVYNTFGCQVALKQADDILNYINSLDIFDDVKYLPFDDAQKSAGFQYMGRETKDAFMKAVLAEAVLTDADSAKMLADLSVVYSPLNGAGNKPVRQMLKQIGVGTVTIVPEQELPDGNFPTSPYPNPEKREALELGLTLCEEVRPDLLLATDPDCDRVGIAVKHEEAYVLLTGNQVGILLLNFICERKIATGTMPKNPITARTIVTSNMVDLVAAHYGVEVRTTLTGFKYIGELIGELEKNGEEERYIFGFEESYGYLAGTYVRDKDAVNGAMLICEMTAYYKAQGKTPVDVLDELYKQHGYFKNDLTDFAFKGSAGMQTMETIMTYLRNNPPSEAAGRKVAWRVDYLKQQRYIIGNNLHCDLAAGTKPTDLPHSNVLEYVLVDGTTFTVRPSGTEPKLKVYFSARGRSVSEADTIIETLKKEMTALVEQASR